MLVVLASPEDAVSVSFQFLYSGGCRDLACINQHIRWSATITFDPNVVTKLQSPSQLEDLQKFQKVKSGFQPPQICRLRKQNFSRTTMRQGSGSDCQPAQVCQTLLRARAALMNCAGQVIYKLLSFHSVLRRHTSTEPCAIKCQQGGKKLHEI